LTGTGAIASEVDAMRKGGASAFEAAVRLKESAIVAPGMEFNAAMAMRASYGLNERLSSCAGG
jgi:hypothetical protein